ncbi:hypothetical protein BcepSauron_135 [Burkholderia phage BcepSauron]|uniref:Uncharacterized protein n=1 Tax=Burkholderia phage BcepSauron TaxID=2530033 RepID=A0A482MLL2_9CAUD|nr:hypothetical protein H1O17_gp135 [Burkholderia phage BcepSauron]QBQ74515.1 hypothetical protein BcepSauron_135 [Burkholderia phage BcepSauron]
MNQHPVVVYRHDLHVEDTNPKEPRVAAEIRRIDGYVFWSPARSLPFHHGLIGNLRERLRCAWLVFTGRADALVWEQDRE